MACSYRSRSNASQRARGNLSLREQATRPAPTADRSGRNQHDDLGVWPSTIVWRLRPVFHPTTYRYACSAADPATPSACSPAPVATIVRTIPRILDRAFAYALFRAIFGLRRVARLDSQKSPFPSLRPRLRSGVVFFCAKSPAAVGRRVLKLCQAQTTSSLRPRLRSGVVFFSQSHPLRRLAASTGGQRLARHFRPALSRDRPPRAVADRALCNGRHDCVGILKNMATRICIARVLWQIDVEPSRNA